MREAAYSGDYEAFKEAGDAYRAKGKTTTNFLDSIASIDPISDRLNAE